MKSWRVWGVSPLHAMIPMVRRQIELAAERDQLITAITVITTEYSRQELCSYSNFQLEDIERMSLQGCKKEEVIARGVINRPTLDKEG